MKWDEVEREFFVLSAQLNRLGHTFGALAAALKRERESCRVTPTKSHAAVEDSKKAGRPEAARIFD